MKIIAIVIALAALSACAHTQGSIKPDETTEQFVSRVINSSGEYVGF